MKSFRLTDDEIKQINEAAAAVEKKSSGEVVTAVIRESSDYNYYELMFSLITGAVYFIVMLLLYKPVSTWINGFTWNPQMWWIPLFYGLSTAAVVSIFYFLANIPGFDRIIVPSEVISKKVHRRALACFSESGIRMTADRTGILFYLSLRERRLEILADSGIDGKVDPGFWDTVLKDVVSDIKAGKAAAGLVKAINKCGEELEKHFPVQKDDINELPDGIIFLED